MKNDFKMFLMLVPIFFTVTVCVDQLFEHGLQFSKWFATALPFYKWLPASIVVALVMQHYFKAKANR